MKQELRCHAVLCPSENKARAMAQRLQERLRQALVDFRREKISRQNARLSLANSVYENPSMPYRKILLHTGSSNYRPPHERGKSAPKLKAIEEEFVDEEGDDNDDDHTLRPEEEEEEEGRSLSPHLAASTSSPSLILRRGQTEPSTEVTSLASEDVCVGPDVGILVDLNDEEGGDGDEKPSFVPMDSRESALNEEVNRRLAATFDEDEEEDEEEEEEEDEVIDYLPGLEQPAAEADRPEGTAASTSCPEDSAKVRQTDPVRCDSEEVDSAAPVSPESYRSSSVRSKSDHPCQPSAPSSASASAPVPPSASSTPRQALDSAHDADSIEEEEDDEDGAGRPPPSAARLSEQDAISDESGYSEESNPSTAGGGGAARRASHPKKEEAHSGKTTVVNLNESSLPRPKKKKRDPEPPPDPSSAARPESPIQCDLTVHSAAHLMATTSSSSSAEPSSSLRGGATAAGGVDFLQNRVAEFCINI